MNRVIDNLLRPWVLLIAALIVAELVWWHSSLGDRGKKELEFAAALATGMGIIYTVLITVQSRRATASARFIERWNDRELTQWRKEIGLLVRGEKSIADVDPASLVWMLNFFEEMSLSSSIGEAQELVLRKFFRDVVLQAATALRPWIEEKQRGQPTAFQEFGKLVNRWKDD